LQLRNKDLDKNILAIRLQKSSKSINFKLDIQFNRYSLKNLDEEDS